TDTDRCCDANCDYIVGDYYISNEGDDSWNGNYTHPWKTISKVNSMNFESGDIILFKRGDVWREQLIPHSGDETGHITYSAYGTGDKPLLLGSVEKNDLNDWIYEGGNIWATQSIPSIDVMGNELLFNPSFDINTNEWHLYSESDAVVTGSRDTVDFDSSPASYKIKCTKSGNQINHIQFYTMNIDITAGNYYKLTFRAKSSIEFNIGDISLMKTSSPWNNYYSFRINGNPTITTDWATYEVLFKSSVTAIDGRITFFLGGVLPEGAIFNIDTLSFKQCAENEINLFGVDVGNIIFNNEESVGIKVWNEENLSTQGEFWYDKENSVIKIYSINNPASYYSDIECALTRHIIDESNKGYIIYENLELKYGGAHGIGGGNTHHIVVRDCDLSYIGGGELEGYHHLVRYGNGVEFWGNAHDNLVERCRIWEIYDSALTNQNNEPNKNQYNIRYQNNIIWNCEWSYEFWNFDENSFMDNISFVSNTCADAGGSWGHSQRPDPWGVHVLNWEAIPYVGQIQIANNIFYKSTDICIYISSAYEGLENLNLNYNCWYQASGNMINFQGYRYTMSQFSMYQSEKSQDQNSIATDPLFVDALNHDFHLQPTSLAIDAGTDVGLTTDFEGNPIVGILDIGAFEYQF
ncbi:carbohydrate binding domain-containing protein, partial [Candidatus Pacearchaeota archaeon]|nr:carbohydrate binding domain-containing protein [Candidatus Pacearchaeota archaeon]